MAGFLDRLLSSIEAPDDVAHGEDDEPSIAHHLIAWRSLEPRMRLILGLVIAEILAAALTLTLGARIPGAFNFAVSNDPLGLCDIPGGAALLGFGPECVRIPIVSYLLAYASIIAGIGLLIAGAAQASARGRIILLSMLALIFGFGILGRPDWQPHVYVGLIVALYGACVVGAPAIMRSLGFPEHVGSRIATYVLAVFGVFFALIFMFVSPFVALLSLLHIPLAYLFLLAGTDWAEMDDTFARWLMKVSRLSENATGLFVATSALCVSTLALMVWSGGWLIAIYAVPAALAVAVFFLALRSARFDGNWPVSLSWAALALVVVFFQVPLEVVTRTVVGVRAVLGQPGVGDFTIWQAAAGAFTVLAVLLMRVAGRRTNLVWLAPAFLYAAVFGLFYLSVSATNEIAVARFCATQMTGWCSVLTIAAIPLQGPCFLVALTSLVSIAWLWNRRAQFTDTANPLRWLFVLNLSLLGLFALGTWLYEDLRDAAGRQAIVAGGVVFVALLWDILSSGHSITNPDGKLFPRRARVLLFFSYVLLAVGTVLFWGSLQGTGAWAQMAQFYADSDRLVEQGLTEYGPAMLLTLFVLRFGKWFFEARRAVNPVPSAPPLGTPAHAAPAQGR